MGRTMLFLIFVNVAALGQIDTNFIEPLKTDKTLQFHTTVKDLAILERGKTDNDFLFRNHNWSTGLYGKWGLAELFVAFPHNNFQNAARNSDRAFGTGFTLNFLRNHWQFAYEFKYVQGFDDWDQIFNERLSVLNQESYFFYNRIHSHYIQNSSRFSWKAATRFNERQKKSAGSLIWGTPIGYHFSNLKMLDEDISLQRFSVRLIPGYGYTHVEGNFAISSIVMAGVDLSWMSYLQRSFSIQPAVAATFSAVYHLEDRFVGMVFNYFPEYTLMQGTSIYLENWKVRIYAGKRFN